eukprot:Rmarinus@m.6303
MTGPCCTSASAKDLTPMSTSTIDRLRCAAQTAVTVNIPETSLSAPRNSTPTAAATPPDAPLVSITFTPAASSSSGTHSTTIPVCTLRDSSINVTSTETIQPASTPNTFTLPNTSRFLITVHPATSSGSVDEATTMTNTSASTLLESSRLAIKVTGDEATLPVSTSTSTTSTAITLPDRSYVSIKVTPS